ncbi:MAG: hypothetical protein RLZ98_3770 [Pseudomonadota bacterium]|jgi:mono/diheme cytochrome c family protein
MTRMFLPIVLMLACLTPAGAQDPDGDAKAGLEFARTGCAECHMVEPGGNPGKAASFKQIAETPGMTGLALSVWLRSPHREMPHISLSNNEIRNVVAYITSLRKQER